MEESIIMAVRCPCCDTLLFESDKHKYKAKVSHMQKGIDDNNIQWTDVFNEFIKVSTDS